jgi:glutathione S-transferase
VRAVLAFAGRTWTEVDDGSISKLMSEPVEHMPVPFMGPPVLIDKKAGFAIAEMPAIVLYLGETLGLMPATPALRAMTMKTVNDANDVLDEITLDGGRQMWRKSAGGTSSLA